MNIESIEHAYRRYARFYDVFFGAVFQPGRKATIDRMNCVTGDRILEVGVGTGLSLPLYPTHVSITGIDVSSDMLARATLRKERYMLDNVENLLLMDAEEMEFADNTFDKVVAMYVASVVPDPERLVSEMRRVCKPNGQMIFVNHFHSANPVLGWIEEVLSPLSRQLGFRPDFSLDRFLEDNDLSSRSIYPVNFLNFSTVVEAINNKRNQAEIPESLSVASQDDWRMYGL